MTSISPPATQSNTPNTSSRVVTPAHAPSASASVDRPQAANSASRKGSYAGATKTAFAPPAGPNHTSSSNTAAGQHARSDTSSQVNGRISIPPAVPAVASPTIVNGNPPSSSIHSGDHSRKPSVTIGSSGPSGYAPNGSSSLGKTSGGNNIQFGAMATNASPNLGSSSPLHQSSSDTLGVTAPSNPRITSPANSPSPIPQPPASGGKPPSALHGHTNSVSFGNFGGIEGNGRSASFSQSPLMAGGQSSHLRRESSHSQHSDASTHGLGPAAGRGYPQQGGRGRGYGSSYGQQMPYSPAQNFRPGPNRSGSVGSFQQQNRQFPPYPNSPHQAPRQLHSPLPPNAQPVSAQPGQMSMQNPHMGQPQYGYPNQAYAYPNMGPQPGYMHQLDPNFMANYYNLYPGAQPPPNMIPPQSPRPPSQFTPGPQGNFQGQMFPAPPPSMSRTSSAVSGSDRPASSMGKPQPSTTPASSQTTGGQNSNQAAPKANKFQKPKSQGIVIKNPDSGEIINIKDSASPAPSNKSSNSISAAPTPPPNNPSVGEESRARAESKSVTKTEGKDLREQLARQHREREEAEAKAAQAKVNEEKSQKEKAAADEKQREAAAAQLAAEDAEKKNQLEAEKASQGAEVAKNAIAEPSKLAADVPEFDEDEIARWEAEEAEEAKREAEREAAYLKKKQAEKDEAARKEAEAFKMADDEMKRAEREAEEAEEARIREKEKKEEKEAETQKSAESADTPNAATPEIATPGEDTPDGSGIRTPGSDGQAMPPPDRKASASANKSKPSALKLETSKSVEPSQPSAALVSLRSAHKLTTLDIQYPTGKASPNPAINVGAKMGKFRYDRAFLLQFRNAYTEKPSEDFSQKLRETIGDGGEPQSARGTPRTTAGGSLMGGRQPSNRGPPPMQQMGAFGAQRPRAGASGTTSEQRFQASTMAMAGGRPPGQNPLAGYVSRPGGFPQAAGSMKMDRTPSSTSLAHPNSPRTASQRGGSQRGNRMSRREDPKDNKNMPLTAGGNVKPIEVTATGWKPRSVGSVVGPALGGDGHLTPDVVQRKVKANLNKMTPNNFDKISDQILAIAHQSKDETDGRSLRQVIQLTFEKATDEAHWAEMYAQFCKRMLESMSPEIKDQNVVDKRTGEKVVGGALFRKYLLTRCQTEFEQGWKVNLPEKPDGSTEEAVILSDEYYTAAAAKRRGLGLVRFIGELYKLQMLTERIMHECVKKLVDYEGTPDEAEVESLTNLLKTIGQQLDSSEKGHTMMDAYFARINNMITIKDLPSRLRFMLMDVVDLRVKNRWQPKGGNTIRGPTTIDEVRAQAAEAERQKEIQRAQENARRGAGGGRLPQGRGDARNLSGGSQLGPPTNTVGMDDLRRLGRNASSRNTSTAAPTFGPPSMFANPRGSNPRRPLNLASANDSSASSRVSTPPGQKDKKDKDESAKSAGNSFSVLATNEGSADAASPSSSPALAKATPAISEVTKNTPTDANSSNQPS